MLFSYLFLQMLKTIGDFRKAYPAERARTICTPALSSASSPRNKFLTIEHSSSYRHMLYIICNSNLFPSFFRRKQNRKIETVGERKDFVDPSRGEV